MSTYFNPNAVAIVGFHDGSAGQIESWFEASTHLEIACFVIDSDDFKEPDIAEENKNRECKTTDFPQNGEFKGRPIIVSSDWIEVIWNMGIRKALCLDPNNRRRMAHIDRIKRKGIQLVSAIHPSVLILPGAVIGEGVWINAGCIIGYKAEVECGVIINTGAQIDHHNVLEICCQVDPGVVTAGNVTLRQCCHIHTGVVLINRIKVGADSVVGAGAVVIKDIPPHSTAVGIPAKVIRQADYLPA